MNENGLEFMESSYVGEKKYPTEQESKMIKLLIKAGIVKNKKEANFFLLACVLIFVSLSMYLFTISIESEPKVIPYEKLTEAQKNQIPIDERIFIEKNLNLGKQE
ncbi:MAG: hypothetical protein RLZZ517_313 [Candidatus Parcubacteria bacterium]|jgi:NADH:ubiquinone oxidoreductase subunit H